MIPARPPLFCAVLSLYCTFSGPPGDLLTKGLVASSNCRIPVCRVQLESVAFVESLRVVLAVVNSGLVGRANITSMSADLGFCWRHGRWLHCCLVACTAPVCCHAQLSLALPLHIHYNSHYPICHIEWLFKAGKRCKILMMMMMNDVAQASQGPVHNNTEC